MREKRETVQKGRAKCLSATVFLLNESFGID